MSFLSRRFHTWPSEQTLHIQIKYQIINGSIELINETPMQIDVFPVNHL